MPSPRGTRIRPVEQDRGLDRGSPLSRRPLGGVSRLRTRQGFGQAQRGGADALAEEGARVVTDRPGCVVQDAGRWSPADRGVAKELLTSWQDEPDLAGLREPAPLKMLAEDEREGFFAL